ncbi:MAG: outer membrane lipoprotein LolB [Thauera phenolivorans]|uniref:Outer-membrane lipoprotein LolB n=1 Tax=Thauera phenolivorans TaxID=1792543 RepID=A0A7X7LW74_9RHOO|nr:lipoprotein insertase outer membrane protein LolB [Thauera phenolivorans]NLF54512.1 outer membrane lipoprotein LolB [Thauera phenolivorans]
MKPRPPRRGRHILLAAGALAMLLAGCAPLTRAPMLAPASRSAASAFLLEGRISATDGTRAASGRIEWRHAPGGDRWTAYSPLGQIAARLESDADGARLLSADGSVLEADSAQTLLPQVIGVEVPVDRLALWVQAVPADGAEVRHTDARGRPGLVIDQGWRIDYHAYAGPDGDAAPARLDVSRGDARIRLVIDQWTPAP